MNLLKIAKTAMKMAYSPYSGFKVGSAVEGGSGKIYTGCNIENASYGATICAERVAITHAIASGEKTIRTVAVVTSSSKIVPPCGLCLQVIAEFGKNPEIHLGTLTLSKSKKLKLKDFFPLSFDKKNLA